MIFVVCRQVNMLTKIERREKRQKLRGESVCRIIVWKRPVVKDKHIKMKPRIYVLCVLDGEYKFIKNKTLGLLKKYVLGCNLGWMNRRFCIQKDDRNVNGVQHSFLRHRQKKQKSTTNRSENSSARARTYERTD